MLCEHTATVVAGYFDSHLSLLARQVMQQHVENCAECQQQTEALRTVVDSTTAWQAQEVPEWNRGAAVGSQLPSPERASRRSAATIHWLQWGPLAASLVMMLAVVFKLQINHSEAGVTLVFGHDRQEQGWQIFAERLEQQQREESLQMMQVVLQQYGDANSENLNRIVDYFDRQRQLDLQIVQAGYQQLIDSDFETVRSMRQLASYVKQRADQ